MKKDQNAQKVIIENEQRTRTRGRSTVKVKSRLFQTQSSLLKHCPYRTAKSINEISIQI